MDHKW